MTRNTINRHTSVHALALGLDEFASADGDPLEMLREVKSRGAVTVACHPHEMSEWFANTWYLWNRRKHVGDLVDLWEVGCRWELFPVISRESLPHIANSDFHRPEHLYAWKTLLNADEDARVRSRGPAARHGDRRSAAHAGRDGGHGVSLAAGLVGLGGLALGDGSLRGCRRPPCCALRRRQRGEPRDGFAPPVSIVKPLRGLDEGLEENLESFFRLDYPSSESRWCSPSRAPPIPAYAAARRVADRHPAGLARRSSSTTREPGGNAKVNRLAGRACGTRGTASSSSPTGTSACGRAFCGAPCRGSADPRGRPRVATSFARPAPASLGSRVEALYLNGCLQPGTALVADVLGMPCVVGKSILVSRRALDTIGGIGALRDYLAEDFVLGRESAGPAIA